MKRREFLNKLNDMTTEELYQELAKLKKELFDYRVKSVTDVIENQAKFKQIKKCIAQLNTVLSHKQKSTQSQEKVVPEGT